MPTFAPADSRLFIGPWAVSLRAAVLSRFVAQTLSSRTTQCSRRAGTLDPEFETGLDLLPGGLEKLRDR